MTSIRQLFHIPGFAARPAWPAAVGAGLLVFAAMFHLAGVEPARRQAEALRTEIQGLRAALARAPGGGAAADRLPAEGMREKLIRQVHGAAEARGVGIERADYRQSREGSVLRCELVLPVRGTWGALRDWLADIMNGMPSLAVDEISLHREGAGSGVVEGRLRLSLFLEAR